MARLTQGGIGGGGSGGGGSVPAFASTAQAQAGSASDVIMSPLGVSLKLRHDLGEERITGMRRYTGNVNAITTGHFAFAAANAPFVQTVYIRAHNATEHAKIISEMTAGSVGIITQSETINTLSRFAVVAQIPVSGSDVPIIRALAVYHAARGTFSNDVDCNLDLIGSIKSGTLKSFDSKRVKGGTTMPFTQNSWITCPHRDAATDQDSDNRMEVFMSSAAGGIKADLNFVIGWASASGSKVCHARVQWSTDNGSTWTTETTLTDILNTGLTSNLPVVASYVIRPNVTGKVIVRWQIQRGSSGTNFYPDWQTASAVEI